LFEYKKPTYFLSLLKSIPQLAAHFLAATRTTKQLGSESLQTLRAFFAALTNTFAIRSSKCSGKVGRISSEVPGRRVSFKAKDASKFAQFACGFRSKRMQQQ